jgi:hypothetical protein
MWSPGLAIGTGCGAIVVIALEGAARAGWPPPLPTAWSLVSLAAIARLAGVVAGNWAGVVLAGYVMYTGGFTLGHASDLVVWGKPASRVAVFVGAALLTTTIAGWGEKGSARDPLRGEAEGPIQTSLEAQERARCATARTVNDLNNVLFVIRGCCELAQSNVPGERDDADWAMVLDAVDRCGKLTQSLLDERVRQTCPEPFVRV